MFDACMMFVEKRGVDIWIKGLFANFLLHLVNLYDYGLLDGSQKLQVIRKLQAFKGTTTIPTDQATLTQPKVETIKLEPDEMLER